MRVLWITNIPLPPICEHLNIPQPVVGGWLYSSLKEIKDNVEEVAVAALWNRNDFICKKIDGITYYMVPSNGVLYKENKQLEYFWNKIYDEFKPDIVHLHGTEYAHGLSLFRVIPREKIMVSIQGLTSAIAEHYNAGISIKEELRHMTPVNLYLKNTIFQQKRSMYNRSKFEIEILKNAKYVIGRTSWDYAHTKAINPDVEYLYCNESLRESFYANKWEYGRCEKHSIFISQSHYPLKGFHMLLKALPLIVNKYPDVKVYIAGNKKDNSKTLRKRLSKSTYDKFVEHLIRKDSLQKYICYTGNLNEKEIVKRFLISNIFISLSSIENSPNSLAEAQLLGVPCISSYVGGAPDFIEQGKSGYLYRFEETEMLAMYICKIFDMGEEELQELSKNERLVAKERHSVERNRKKLMDIYKYVNRK